jgi:mannose-1-phosphate guanylyltransferase
MPKPWVVVLAGGEGRRLHSLTRALYGVDLPKQFATLAGDRTLLQQTVDRALRQTVPERVLVVVGETYASYARDQVEDLGVELVLQPRNLDTGPGLLLPLVRILVRDPEAHVVILPSDHYVGCEAPLLAALERRDPMLTLLGVEPGGPDPDYGYIVPGARLAPGAFAIARFVEKPEDETAAALVREGAVWNTFISAGPLTAYWNLARRYLPDHAARFEYYGAAIGSLGEPLALEHAYRGMAAANFSHEVLARASGLAMLPVAGSGWSDWGSPKRVFETLAGTPDHDRLVARIRQPHAELFAR